MDAVRHETLIARKSLEDALNRVKIISLELKLLTQWSSSFKLDFC